MQTGREASTTATTQPSSHNFIQRFLHAAGNTLGNTLPYAMTNHTAHLPGIPLLQLWQPGGLGMVMSRAEAAASKHPNEICVFHIGPYIAAYVRRQSHISDIYHQNHPDAHPTPKNGDTSGIYPYLFGHSILDMLSSDPEYPEERRFYYTSLMSGDRLANSAKLMNQAIEIHLKKYPPENLNNVHELKKFVNRLILTMVAETQLGLVDLSEQEKDRLSELVSAILPELSNIKLVAHLQLEATMGCRPAMALDKILTEGYAYLQTLIDRNKDHILAEPSDPKYELFLRKFIRKTVEEKRKIASDKKTAIEAKIAKGETISDKEQIAVTVDIENTITMESVLAEQCHRFTALVLFAGYESTSTSAFFALLTLAAPKHHELLNQLRDTITDTWDGSRPLTKEDVDKMKLLNEVVQENLRHHPPFPTFKDKLNADIMLGDVLLKKGTILFISPYRTHRITNKENLENPQEFMARPPINAKDPSYRFFTFGPEPTRTCVGMDLAKLETKMLLAHLIPQYSLHLHSMRFPFPVKEEYSLQLANSVNQQDELITLKKLGKTAKLNQSASTSSNSLDKAEHEEKTTFAP